jgi:serine/threonine-protein kinase
VAVKVLHRRHGSNPAMVSRFVTEARAVSAIGHPHIVEVIDAGTAAQTDGRPPLHYIVMELLPGESLGALLAREGPQPVERVIAIGRQVAAAIAASHARGIIHRDLKPGNIVFARRVEGAEEVAKVVDFGMAKLLGDEAPHRTSSGVVVGTLAYMAPEQLRGEAVDGRTDVFALGVLLFELLTGRLPFSSDEGGAALLARLSRPPDAASQARPDAPAWLESVLLRALAPRPADRFASMQDFLSALESRRPVPAAVRDAETVELRTEGSPPPRRRRPLRRATLAAGFLGLAAALLWIALRPPPAPERAAPPPAPDAAPVVVAPAPDAAPARVQLTLRSQPSGAEAIVAGAPRGKTPLDLELPRDSGEVEILFRLPGHADEVRRLPTTRDALLEVTLKRRPAGARPPERVGDNVVKPEFAR